MKSIGFNHITATMGTGFGYNHIIELPSNKQRGRITGITAGYGNIGGFITSNGFGRVIVVGESGIDDQRFFDPQFPVPLDISGNEMFRSAILFDYLITFRPNDFNTVNIELLDGINLDETKNYSIILTYYNDYFGFSPPAPPILGILNVRGSYQAMKNPFGEIR